MGSELKYDVPETPPRPFRKGDRVDVMSRNSDLLGTYRVKKATEKAVTISDDREFSQRGWWWDGEREYPFPWIRLAE